MLIFMFMLMLMSGGSLSLAINALAFRLADIHALRFRGREAMRIGAIIGYLACKKEERKKPSGQGTFDSSGKGTFDSSGKGTFDRVEGWSSARVYGRWSSKLLSVLFSTKFFRFWSSLPDFDVIYYGNRI